jgi:hypothetical protein
MLLTGRKHTRAIWKVTSGFQNKQREHNFIKYIVVATGIEALFLSGNKFLY